MIYSSQYRKYAFNPPSTDEIQEAVQIIQKTTARQHRQEVVFDCPILNCGTFYTISMRTLDLVAIINHVNRDHLKISPFQCSLCEYLNPSPTGVSKHYLLKHGKQRSPESVIMADPAFLKVGKFLHELQNKNVVHFPGRRQKRGERTQL